MLPMSINAVTLTGIAVSRCDSFDILNFYYLPNLRLEQLALSIVFRRSQLPFIREFSMFSQFKVPEVNVLDRLETYEPSWLMSLMTHKHTGFLK